MPNHHLFQGCPCSAPVASSQALSVHPPECPTSATSPLITENLSGVPQSTPQLSEPCEEAESTEEEGNNTSTGEEEAKCETVPVVCVEAVDTMELSHELSVNGDDSPVRIMGQSDSTQMVMLPEVVDPGGPNGPPRGD